MKEVGRKKAGRSALEIDDLVDLDRDLNAVIRENFEFLKEQMVIDECDARFVEEDGPDWIKKRTGKSIQELAKSDSEIRFRLEKFVSEIVGVEGWHFQTKDIEFPKPTRKWIAERTGITVKRQENLDKPAKSYASGGRTGGAAFTVDELVAIARATHTSIQYLLTPPARKIMAAKGTSYQSSIGKVFTPTAPSQWILWIYSLRPLPEQNPFLFERNGSYLSGRLEPRTKTAKPFRDDVIKGLARGRYGELSMIASVENYDPLDKKLAEVKISTNFPSKPIVQQRELWVVRNLLGTFVEARKLLREETLRSTEKQLVSRWRTGSAKLLNHLVRLGRLLRVP